MKIKTNAIEAKHFFNSLARVQLPYAVSRAINHLAYTAREDEQALIGYYFTMRGANPWLARKGAMPVVASRKGQWPNVHAIIGVRDEVAALSATGGVRKPGLGGKMAVPQSNTRHGGQPARSLLNPGQETLGPRFFPKRIVRPVPRRKGRAGGKPRPFLLKSSKGTFVVQRGTGGLQFLYSMKRQARVKAQWPLTENVQLHVQRYYTGFLEREIEAAVASARYP